MRGWSTRRAGPPDCAAVRQRRTASRWRGEIHLASRCELLVDDLEGARPSHPRARAFTSRQAWSRREEAASSARSPTSPRAKPQRLPRGPCAASAPPIARCQPVDRPAVRLEAEARPSPTATCEAPWGTRRAWRGHRHPVGTSCTNGRSVRARSSPGAAPAARRACARRQRCWPRTKVPALSLDVRAALALHGRRLAAFDVSAPSRAEDGDVFTSVERWRAISHAPAITTRTSSAALLAHCGRPASCVAARATAARRPSCARRGRSPLEDQWPSASGPSRRRAAVATTATP